MLKPVRTTIVFALLSGITMAFFQAVLPYYWGWVAALKMSAALNLVIYGLLLCHWSRTPGSRVIYPLLFVAGAALYPSSLVGFLLIGLAVLSWIRSGICYPKQPVKSFIAEMAVLTGVIMFALAWQPASPLAAGLGCWLFFLVQSLYFFMLPEPLAQDRETKLPDRFEQISRDMERLLAVHEDPVG